MYMHALLSMCTCTVHVLYIFLSFSLQVSINLAQFHLDIRNIARHACEEALRREQFVPDPIRPDDLKNNGNAHISIITLMHVL